MRLRGIAAGLAVAILVLVTITLFSIWKLYEAYVAASMALSRQAEVQSKPVLRIESILANESSFTIYLTNYGPEKVLVQRVFLLTYGESNEPAEVRSGTPINKYLPVGGTLPITISVEDIASYYGLNRPLRVVVETDRGLVTTGYPPLVSYVTVNIHLPDYLDPHTLAREGKPLELEVVNTETCLADNPVITFDDNTPLCRTAPPNASRCYDPDAHTLVARLRILALGTCKLKLYSTSVPIRSVRGDWVKAKQVNPGETDVETIDLGGVIELKSLNYMYEVPVKPGGTVTIDISIPDIMSSLGTIKRVEHEISAQVIDFSWYYYPVLQTSGGYVVAAEGTKTYRSNAADITLDLIRLGIISVSSPSACEILPSENNTVEYNYRYLRLSTEPMWSSPVGIATATGVLLVAKDYPIGCNNYDVNRSIITVAIPMYLTSGTYVIVPVFAVDDDRNSENILSVSVEIAPPGGGNATTVFRSPPFGEAYQTFQFAFPIKYTAPDDGVYVLKINVLGLLQHGLVPPETFDVSLVVSKIVILKASAYEFYCAIPAGRPPTYPFVLVDVYNAEIRERLSTVVANPAYLVSNDLEAQESRSNRTLFLSTSTGEFYRRKLVIANDTGMHGVFVVDTVSGSIVENITDRVGRPIYVEPGYRVEIVPESDIGNDSTMWALIPAVFGPEPSDVYTEAGTNYDLLRNINPTVVAYTETYTTDRIRVRIYFGTTTIHYIIIAFAYWNEDWGEYRVAPSVYAYGNGATVQVLYPPDGDFSQDPMYTAETVILAHPYSANSYVDIYFTFGVPQSGSGDAYIAIGHIVVVRDTHASTTLSFPENVDYGLDYTGLYLTNVTPVADVVSVDIIDARTGAVVASWGIDAANINSSDVIRLNLAGYVRAHSVADPNAADYMIADPVPTILVIRGAICGGIGPATTNYTTPSPAPTTPSIPWYYTEVTISSAVSYSGYVVKVDLPADWDGWSSNARMETIAFYDPSTRSYLPYWIARWDPDSRTATIYVKVDLAPPTKVIRMYWTNSFEATNPAPLLANNPDLVFWFYDDFSTDPRSSGKWRVYRYGDSACVWSSATGTLYLTEAVRYQGCAIVMNTSHSITTGFHARFRYRVGGGSGADGMTFFFYKDARIFDEGTLQVGGSLALTVTVSDGRTTRTVTSHGYAIEFDSWDNGAGDPSDRHLALINTNTPAPYDHIDYVNTPYVDDDRWHIADVYVSPSGTVRVLIDGELMFENTINYIDDPYAVSAGFTAATGGATNNHILDWVWVAPYVEPEPTVAVSSVSYAGTPP